MKTLVIAPKGLFGTLYNIYRKSDPFNDAKFITKEELIKNASYDYTSEAILYLISHFDFDYNLASKFLKEMRYISKSNNNPKVGVALTYFKKLEEVGLIIRNEYYDYELENSDIKIYGYSKSDPELAYFLKKYSHSFVDLTLKNDLEISKFDDYEDELFYLFNEIGRLLSEGVPSNEIAIYGLKNELNLSS